MPYISIKRQQEDEEKHMSKQQKVFSEAVEAIKVATIKYATKQNRWARMKLRPTSYEIFNDINNNNNNNNNNNINNSNKVKDQLYQPKNENRTETIKQKERREISVLQQNIITAPIFHSFDADSNNEEDLLPLITQFLITKDLLLYNPHRTYNSKIQHREGEDTESVEDEGIVFHFCKDCNKHLYGVENYKIHLKGRKHKQILKKQKQQQEPYQYKFKAKITHED